MQRWMVCVGIIALVVGTVTGVSTSDNYRAVTGTGIIKPGVEGGCWIIISCDGTVYEPLNLPPPYRASCLAVSFQGILRPDIATICMQGIPMELVSISPVSPVIPGTSPKSHPPSDPDGDCLYEDTNGNGLIDYDDAVILFWNLDWISENEPIPVFDFNGNGIMDYDDAVTLFWQV